MSSFVIGQPPVPPGGMPHRFSVEEFRRMVEADVFLGQLRVELIEGQVIEQMTHNPAHDGSLTNLEALIQALLPAGWHLRGQKAVTLSASQPVPDACVVVGGLCAYFLTHPAPAQIALIAEVSDTTLRFDRATKGPMYARDRVGEYWVVNIPDRVVEVYTLPSGPVADPSYGDVRVYAAGTSVPLVLGGVALGDIRVDDLFP